VTTPPEMWSVPLALRMALKQGGFSLDVAWEGRCRLLGLFGPSGSGKTTLLEVVGGLRRAHTARIAVGDAVLRDTSQGIDVPIRDRGIGYVPQDSALFPHLGVRENIAYGASRGKAVPLEPILAMLSIAALIDRKVSDLSGGERQRVALARALVSSPRLLLLDEPLSAVDVPLRRRILESLGDWVTLARVPTIHVSHDAGDLQVATDHVLVLREGRLAGEGTASPPFFSATY
jgi:molybdate transport system ATP-binding protein